MSRVLEIERKFVLGASTERRLAECGALPLGPPRHFHDAYFDDAALSLALADHWLRRRDQVWQLKYPVRVRAPAEEVGALTRVVGEATGMVVPAVLPPEVPAEVAPPVVPDVTPIRAVVDSVLPAGEVPAVVPIVVHPVVPAVVTPVVPEMVPDVLPAVMIAAVPPVAPPVVSSAVVPPVVPVVALDSGLTARILVIGAHHSPTTINDQQQQQPPPQQQQILGSFVKATSYTSTSSTASSSSTSLHIFTTTSSTTSTNSTTSIISSPLPSSCSRHAVSATVAKEEVVGEVVGEVGGKVGRRDTVKEDERLMQQYVETECEQEIVLRVAAVLASAAASTGNGGGAEGERATLPGSVEEMVQRAQLRPFAEFSTERRRYLFPGGVERGPQGDGGGDWGTAKENGEEDREGRVCVDLDTSDFGYAVGELEVVCREERAIPRAVIAIQAAASQLELVSGTNLLSKLAAFLRDHRRDLYRRLVDAHVLA